MHLPYIYLKGNDMSKAAQFIIFALLIFGGVLAFKTYKEGGFTEAKSINTPIEQDVESH